MAGAARTEMLFERQAAMLQRGAYCAAKIETPAPRTMEPPAQTRLPAATQDRKRVTRLVVFQRRITYEGDAFKTPQIRERGVNAVMFPVVMMLWRRASVGDHHRLFRILGRPGLF